MSNNQRLYGGFDRNELPTQLISDQAITAEPMRQNQIGLSVATVSTVYQVANDTVATNSTINIVVLASNSPLVGDILRFTSGSLTNLEFKIKAVSGQNCTMCENLPSIPSVGDGVEILRYKYQVIGADGIPAVDANITNTVGNPVPVTIVNQPPGTSATNIYNEVSSVPSNVETTILTYTVPVGQNFFFELAEVSGTAPGDYTIKINGTKAARQYTYYTTLTGDFQFYGLKVTTGQTITISVLQIQSQPIDFTARIVGALS